MSGALEAAARAVAEYDAICLLGEVGLTVLQYRDVIVNLVDQERAQAAIAAYLAAREAEGFVMVPVVPTEGMIEAGGRVMDEVRKSAQAAIAAHEVATIRFSACMVQGKDGQFTQGQRWVTTSAHEIALFFLACWNARHEIAKEKQL